MSAQLRPSIHQINLYNVSLFPAREVFTARRISVGVVAAVLVMTALGWWALAEKHVPALLHITPQRSLYFMPVLSFRTSRRRTPHT